MSKATARAWARRTSAPVKELVRILTSIAHTRSIHDVFRDFLEVSALAITNAVDLAQFEPREKRYFEVIKPYNRTELTQFAEAFANLTLAVWQAQQCVLGGVMTQLELGNQWIGQVFSPWEVCHLMARLNFANSKSEVEAEIAEKGFITVNDPCCGAGTMLLATARALMDLGIDYRKCLHATGVDIDSRCVHMTYLQLAMMELPAHVIEGNTMTLRYTQHWFTRNHILGCWGARTCPEGLQRALASEDPEIVAAARMMQRVVAGELDLLKLSDQPGIGPMPSLRADRSAQQLAVAPPVVWTPPVTRFVVPRVSI